MMTKKRLYYRESVVSLLRKLAAESPGESFDELVCGWFDDLYLPGFDPEDCNPGVHEKGVMEFNNCFHLKELQAPELFHRTFGEQIKYIPDNIQYQEMTTNQYWQNIRQAASKALEEFYDIKEMG